MIISDKHFVHTFPMAPFQIVHLSDTHTHETYNQSVYISITLFPSPTPKKQILKNSSFFLNLFYFSE